MSRIPGKDGKPKDEEQQVSTPEVYEEPTPEEVAQAPEPEAPEPDDRPPAEPTEPDDLPPAEPTEPEPSAFDSGKRALGEGDDTDEGPNSKSEDL